MCRSRLLVGVPLALGLVLLLSFHVLLADSSPPTQPHTGEIVTDQPASATSFSLTQEWQRCPYSNCETGWYASPAVADLDENGVPEVYWGGYSLMAVDGASGALLTSVPGKGGRLWPSIVATDLDGDGVAEIVVANGSGEVHVYGEGLVRRLGWPKQPFGNDSEIRSLAVADLDNDGKQEIILCSTRSDNQWIVLEHNGVVAVGWPQMTDSDLLGYASGCYNQNVAAGDIDGDGMSEIVGTNDTHYVAAFNANGSPVLANGLFGTVGGSNKPWARVGLHVDQSVDERGYAECGIEHRPNMANSAPVIADLDGDGTHEVIFVGNVYNCDGEYTSLYEVPFVLNGDRTRWTASGLDWTVLPTPRADAAPLSEDYERIESNLPNPVIADLDNDGFPEILHTSYDGKLHAWSLGKAEHDNWPYDLQPADRAYLRFGSEPVVADLDGDGNAEVILATWTENGSNAPGQLLILSHEGNLLQAIDLPWDPADGRGGALGAPTLANLDDDANLEVVVGTINRGLVAYEIANSAQARVLWGTGRGSFARSGFVGTSWASQPVQAVLAVDKPSAAPGEAIVYRLEIANPGHMLAAVQVTVALPSGATLDMATIGPSAGASAQVGGELQWQVEIAPGQTEVLTWRMTIDASAPEPGVLETTARVVRAGVTEVESRLQVLISPLRTTLPIINHQ